MVDLNYRKSTKINYPVNEVIKYKKGLMIIYDFKIIVTWLNLVIIITTGSVRYTIVGFFFKANAWIFEVKSKIQTRSFIGIVGRFK